MYQSLYRKYRPSNFDEVVGQEVPVKILKNAILNNRIAHAYLFSGIRGTGKTSIAKIFAKTVNCLNPVDGTPCNKCVVCTQNNTDIVEIDAASNNGVDEIRELRDKIALVPSISKYKVYIIDEVHMLSTSAFNALLKTLEEPPAHAIFILATTEVYKIPSTILSRCQRLDFKAITMTNLEKRLKYICEKENIKIAAEALSEIARLANGGMRDAISLLEQVWAYSDNITIEDVHKMNGTLGRAEIKELLRAIMSNKVQEAFSLVNKYDEQGVNFAKLIEELIYFVRNLILLKNGVDINDSLYLKSDYEEFKELVSLKKLIDYIKKFNATSASITTVSNKKIVFEMMIINLINVEEETSAPESLKATDVPSKTIVNSKYVESISVEFMELQKEQKMEEEVLTPPLKNEKIEESDLQKLKKIRVENTLAEFEKKILLSLQKELEALKNYVTDLNYQEIASILLDGKLKAASNSYLLFVYDEEIASLKFNQEIKRIEELLSIVLKNNYKVIAIDNDEWEKIKVEFNSKRKKYIFIEENAEIGQIIESLKKTAGDFLEDNFSDIITYE